jgi:hypothetical protein
MGIHREQSTAGWSLAVVAILLTAALLGCASGPKPIEPVDVAAMAVEADHEGAVRIVEHTGSDIGEPIPFWMTVPVEELEQTGEYAGRHVFRFQVADVELGGVLKSIQDFPASRQTSRAVHDRAVEKVGGVAGLPAGLIDEAGRVLLVIEYMGYRRCGEFWVHEILLDAEGKQTGERYRGWVLVSVPRDQVMAALQLAYDTAASHNPIQSDRDRQARAQLLVRFRNGL